MQHKRSLAARVGPLSILPLLVGLSAACGDEKKFDGPDPGAGKGGDRGGGASGGTGAGSGGSAGAGGALGGAGGSAADIVVAPAATRGDFSAPLDAAPNSSGTLFYFSANSSTGPAIFSVPAAGGEVTRLSPEGAFITPVAIAVSADDTTIFVADIGFEGENGEHGQIFALPTAGGEPLALAGTSGSAPRGLAVLADQLYFSGSDPSDGQAGIFRIPVAGGALIPLAKGAPFNDPSGVAVTRSGDVYVADTLDAAGSFSNIIHVEEGAAQVFEAGLRVGYPAGVALTLDDAALLVSGLGATGTSLVYAINLGSHEVNTFSNGIGDNLDSGGLHRALKQEVFAWCGVTAGAQGTVFRVELK